MPARDAPHYEPRRFGWSESLDRIESLIAATEPLLDMWAMLDNVFTEDDALSPAKRQMTLGRIYEQYKRSRKVLDPDFARAQRVGRADRDD